MLSLPGMGDQTLLGPKRVALCRHVLFPWSWPEQVLMTKTLPPLRGSCRVELGRGGASRSQAAAGSSSSSGSSGNGGSSSSGAGGVSAGEAVVSGVSGRSREKDGVFVWGAVVEGAGDVGPTDKGAERPGQ